MGLTPEGKVKEKVKRLLKKYNCYYFMPVQTGYGAPTLDILVCAGGVFLAIETKAPGKKPTARQELTISEIRRAGGLTIVVDGDTSELESVLKRITKD